MSGSKELMILTSSSLQNDKNQKDVLAPKEGSQILVRDSKDMDKSQDENEPAQSNEKSFLRR